MANEADIADVQVEAHLAAARAVRKPETPPATGYCFYCKCSVPQGLRWCDTGCKSDWEIEQEAERRNGVNHA